MRESPGQFNKSVTLSSSNSSYWLAFLLSNFLGKTKYEFM